MIRLSRLSAYLTLLFLFSLPAFSQVPPPKQLSAEDMDGMTRELNHWQQLLPSANDQCTIEFQIARTYAAGGQYSEALCLGYIDGVYAHRDSLIAIQIGPMAPRIVQFFLAPDNSDIIAMRILERRNPMFDGLTTGALVGDRFYYIANTQIDKKDAAKVQLNPLRILSIDLALVDDPAHKFAPVST